MVFGISEKDFFDKNKIKVIDGIAGAGKSTSVVSELEAHNEVFCLASFSNALKFAASDKFGCNTDTICGLCFINTPYPRTDEREVKEYNTVVLDEVLLDGLECLKWIRHNVGKVNIIALTDSHQMLSVENSQDVLKVFNNLCSQPYVIYKQLTDTKRARNDETKQLYNKLFNINSNVIYNLEDAKNILECDVINFEDITYSNSDTFICHSNKIEHEIYKRYDLSSNRNIPLIPKNHISRNRTIDMSKYPICDQVTATEKHLDAYLQAANVATPTRFQGKEVDVTHNCYFIVEEGNFFTGRELYTVGTRCQNKCSIHIVLIHIEDYNGPAAIRNIPVVNLKHLNIPGHDKTFKHITGTEMSKIIKEYGDPETYYASDYVTSGDSIIYATCNMSVLSDFCYINEDPDNYTVTIKKKAKAGRIKNIRSVTKKDTTMHFDFMPRAYEIMQCDIIPPRIQNPKDAKKDQFDRLIDIYSAFPTVLHNAPMPKAGVIYTERSDDLLNFYRYNGKVVTKGSLITEELANKLGNSDYMFSTNKQIGCELGHYTYEQCKTSKEKKKNVSEHFLWGILEKDYYKLERVVRDGETSLKYVKYERNTLELVACALWSSLCSIMLDAIGSINTKNFMVVTDGLYYNGDKIPTMPEWCDYRVEDKLQERLCGKDTNDKYSNIIFKTYEDLPTDRQLKKAKEKANKCS